MPHGLWTRRTRLDSPGSALHTAPLTALWAAAAVEAAPPSVAWALVSRATKPIEVTRKHGEPLFVGGRNPIPFWIGSPFLAGKPSTNVLLFLSGLDGSVWNNERTHLQTQRTWLKNPRSERPRCGCKPGHCRSLPLKSPRCLGETALQLKTRLFQQQHVPPSLTSVLIC